VGGVEIRSRRNSLAVVRDAFLIAAVDVEEMRNRFKGLAIRTDLI
jgi:hypothetical protein